MTSSPDRPFQTLSDSDLAARIEQNRRDQEGVANKRNDAAKRVYAQLRRTYAELCAERDYRHWLKFDLNFSIPKIDAQPPILTEASRVHEVGEGVCSVGNVGEP